VAADFTNRLRATVRFDSVPELIAQMHRDVDEARQLLGG
jgi:FAD synthase